jgi:hypothetical protein
MPPLRRLPVWVKGDAEPGLAVLPEPPEDCRIPGIGSGFGGPDEVRSADFKRHFHRCHWCEGWIEGRANQSGVNTLGPLSGRRGTEYNCRRCGREIGFAGMMS